MAKAKRLPPPPPEAPRNPFRDPIMRGTYDACLRCYYHRHKDIRHPDGRRGNGNGWASMFWRGYDNVAPQQWDAASRRMIGYACYRAGRDVARKEGAN